MKHLAVLGSTGSIGTQTLDIVRNFPELFKVEILTANNNWELLAAQAREFRPKRVIVANEDCYEQLKYSLTGTGIEVKTGKECLNQESVNEETDIVVTALVGFSGLVPTIHAIKNGKTIALANKETLVVAGEIITQLAKSNNVSILPVDSEHSAIFQCLQGEETRNISKIILTASGGPFRTYSKEDLKRVTVRDALNHPNWSMGAKVTIDSASMMNKGFEMIEARWLFDCQPKDIEILVHPQSIVHSMVEFCDGSIKAQLGIPDMRIPIQYALSYPTRLPAPERSLDWKNISQLSFEQPDTEKFPLLKLAFTAIEKGGNMPCVLNAANEIAVSSFLKGKISFTMMPELVKEMMVNIKFINHPSLEDLLLTDKITREKAQKWVETHCL